MTLGFFFTITCCPDNNASLIYFDTDSHAKQAYYMVVHFFSILQALSITLQDSLDADGVMSEMTSSQSLGCSKITSGNSIEEGRSIVFFHAGSWKFFKFRIVQSAASVRPKHEKGQ